MQNQQAIQFNAFGEPRSNTNAIFLAEVRARSDYFAGRVFCTLAAVSAQIALIVTLWPVDVYQTPGYPHDEYRFVSGKFFIILACSLAVWGLWHVVRAFHDRCDLALRSAATPRG